VLQFTGPRAEAWANMRTHGFRSHVLLVLAGAIGLLSSLSRPWYAHAPKPRPPHTADIGDVNGPLNGLFQGMRRWVSDPSGVTGWHALGTSGTALAALAGICALCALCVTTPALQAVARTPLRYSAMAATALVAWRLVDPPGPNVTWELRHGALIAAAGVLVMLCGALPVASAPRRARTATPTYVPPTPPPPLPVYDTSSSVAPPGP
jgi:hypothetical protein